MAKPCVFLAALGERHQVPLHVGLRRRLAALGVAYFQRLLISCQLILHERHDAIHLLDGLEALSHQVRRAFGDLHVPQIHLRPPAAKLRLAEGGVSLLHRAGVIGQRLIVPRRHLGYFHIQETPTKKRRPFDKLQFIRRKEHSLEKAQELFLSDRRVV